MSEVTYFDRRDGTRKVVPHDIEWSGPFWWAEGNASCDCNRTMMMYGDEPDKVTETCTSFNLIIVEQIVDNGQVVYREKQAEVLPPRVIAVVNIDQLLSSMITVAQEQREEGDLAASLDAFRQGKVELAAHNDTASMVTICDQITTLVEKIVAAEANLADPLDVNAAWREVEDCRDDLNELTEEIGKSVGSAVPIDYKL